MGLVVSLTCPLNPQLVKADGHASCVWFCQRFFPVKRVFFSFHSRLVHAQNGGLHRRKVSLQSVDILS